jgi:hypothetical protein
VVLTEGGEVWTWGEPWGEFALELQRAPRKVRSNALHHSACSTEPGVVTSSRFQRRASDRDGPAFAVCIS